MSCEGITGAAFHELTHMLPEFYLESTYPEAHTQTYPYGAGLFEALFLLVLFLGTSSSPSAVEQCTQ